MIAVTSEFSVKNQQLRSCTVEQKLALVNEIHRIVKQEPVRVTYRLAVVDLSVVQHPARVSARECRMANANSD